MLCISRNYFLRCTLENSTCVLRQSSDNVTACNPINLLRESMKSRDGVHCVSTKSRDFVSDECLENTIAILERQRPLRNAKTMKNHNISSSCCICNLLRSFDAFDSQRPPPSSPNSLPLSTPVATSADRDLATLGWFVPNDCCAPDSSSDSLIVSMNSGDTAIRWLDGDCDVDLLSSPPEVAAARPVSCVCLFSAAAEDASPLSCKRSAPFDDVNSRKIAAMF